MNSWRTTAITLLKSLITFVLVLSLTSCGEKAVSQEPFGNLQPNSQISTKQFSEVAPPTVVQELRNTTDLYRPQVSIISPKSDEILPDNTVTVSFQIKDLPIYKDPKFNLGPHLEVILDNKPAISIYDLNQPLVLSDLPPGTHTLRVFASRPWRESYKNEGAYTQTTFHVFTKSDSNNPNPALPLLTYNSPDGNYGAEPILLDFYLTNAPLHLLAKDNPDNLFADWRIRCTINGESFVLDSWQAVYLKGFKPGKNWVKLEFLDSQGNTVKNEFNSTVRLITYEPKGKDTLSQIFRGQLSADQVRTIVDPNYTYTVKTPTAEPTPEILPEQENLVVPESEPTTTPRVTPSVETTPEPQPQQEKQPVPETQPTPSVTPTVESTPEIAPKQEKPILKTEPTHTPSITPTVETTPEPILETQSQKPRFGGFFKRRATKVPTPQPTVEPYPEVNTPTLPEIIIESPVLESSEQEDQETPTSVEND
ncbi:MAG: hypothetical protein KME28_24990 [Pelatocladus maniniholoensis HA4357-MV3]|jgi:hypothetical protein|uniref:FHA domain containing protein n=1 Tax=Pelatocladus maniniholoensis HA4357-MV3 TaxID=1117104 RepID=A0A9E3LWG7_9NOST|nr:hypothetical protein [Pelatocladus maniniholoensis HA4357-MV3]